jgi:methyl-accepting chemotaxis protein
MATRLISPYLSQHEQQKELTMSTFWNNCTIKVKLLLGIGAILAIFAVSSAIVLYFVSSLASAAKTTLNDTVPTKSAALAVQFRLVDADDNAGYIVMDPNKADWASDLHDFNDDIASVKAEIPKLADASRTPRETAKIAAFATWFDGYVSAVHHAFSLKNSGNVPAAITSFVNIPTNNGQALIADFVDSTSHRTDLATAAVNTSSQVAVAANIAGALTAIVVGGLIAVLLGGAIAKRLQKVTTAMEEIVQDDFSALDAAMKQFAAGDLTIHVSSSRAPIETVGNDETALLANSYNRLLDGIKAFGSGLSSTGETLNAVIKNVKSSADEVSISAREISAGNGDLSQRTEEQAASLEETAASMEELTATVNQNAENARQANTLAIGASEIAIKGGDVVGEVVQTMAAINESGKKIVDIISVIDGIAFQTNILALNAAVEAARAGEQGRGFAVVAGEVRTLAQRSAAAAKEIKTLIGDSVEKTAAGTTLVGKAGATMDEIVRAVKRVTEIMSAIAAASQQQGSGIGQVNDAVMQMDKVTQQNSALVEEIAAAAKALEERAQGLVASVSVFTLTNEEDESTTRRAERPRALVPPAPRAAASLKAPRRFAAAAAPAPARHTDATDSDWSSF